MERLGYTVFVALIFVRYSRIIEQYDSLHIPRILLLVALAIAVFNGRIVRGLYHKLGVSLVVLTALYTISVPFSVWPGGAFDFLTTHWYRSALMFFMAVAYVNSWRRIRAVMIAFGSALAYVAAKAVSTGQTVTQRATGADHTFGNSNDFAMVMLFGLPLCAYMAMEKRLPTAIRLCGLAGVPIMAYPMSQTGSRMMLLVSTLLCVYVLFKVRPAARLGLAAGALGLAMVAVATMPRTALARLGTFFNPRAMMGDHDPVNDPLGETGGVDARLLGSAVDSSYQRMFLLKRSVALAFSNPVFGVGTGQFDVAEHNLAVAEGAIHGSWQEAHNAYTQIAAENGLAALAVYLTFLWRLWQTLTGFERLRPADHARFLEWRRLAFAQKASLLSYLLCSLFLSIGYQDFIPVFAGLAASGDFVLKREQIILERQRAAAEEPAMLPSYADRGYGPAAVSYSAGDAVAQGD